MEYKLLCGCESTLLEDLIYGYEYSECGELYKKVSLGIVMNAEMPRFRNSCNNVLMDSH
jgi:hypothetical protein